MQNIIMVMLLLAGGVSGLGPEEEKGPDYAWLEKYDESQSMENRIHVPVGFERVKAEPGGFGWWLRKLALKPGKPPVMLYNGKQKWNQSAHHAVVEMDVGKRDRQQCADAVMRLRGEYLYSRGEYKKIRFNYTHKDTTVKFWDWAQGKRPKVVEFKKDGKRRWRIDWVKSRRKGTDYKNFREYMENVFSWAGTHSLARELVKVEVAEMRPGDVFIQGGFPGHAILVLDVAVNQKTGKKVFMVGQSYMPAQEFHLLKNPGDSGLSPWYPVDFGSTLETPEWVFKRGDLKRFKD